MFFKFIGVPGENHDSLFMFGKDYPLDVSVETEGAHAQKKLQNHPHFEVVIEGADDGNTNGSGDTGAKKVGRPRGK